MESILTSIKKLLGITEECTDFDDDIIMHINSVFLNLKQIGIGPENGFNIINKLTTWEEYIPWSNNFEAIKIYIYLKVKLAFDPSASSVINENYKELIKEYEWRLNIESESTTL